MRGLNGRYRHQFRPSGRSVGVNGDTAIQLGNNGVNSLILQTGPTIVGAADDGRGNSNAYLEGSGTVDNAFCNFDALTIRCCRFIGAAMTAAL